MRAFWLLFVLALPLLLFTTALHLAATSPSLYTWGFGRYGVAARLDTEPEALARAAREITAYWSSGEERLQISLKLGGAEAPLFSQKEVAHLADVKRLLRLNRSLQLASLGYALAFLLGGFLWKRRAFAGRLFSGLRWGGLLTLASLLAVGLAAVTDFSRFFTLFHLVSFSNLLWLLDPARDRLIQMFPQEFFMSATLMVVIATALGGLGLLLLGWWGKRKLPARRGA